ncbi:protein N-terminal asparagine amidohydrolase [Lepeophtheirus salmonis]|nr:protein N-terminal asparagine amidohydrolase-like [Lepeophtheirus salmonis]XP_040566848.1 protein N-terminal asparagine amidohydrolase-like [Lepeophtheirus salmonis]
MVLFVNGVSLDEAPRDIRSFFLKFPQFKESSSSLTSATPRIIGPLRSLYVSQREFAVTHPHDNKVTILGSDDITTAHLLIIRHTGSGATGFCHLDAGHEEGISSMIQRILSLSFHYDGRFEMHLLGGFADPKGIAQDLTVSILQILHKQRAELDLITCAVNELCTLHRNGVPWPLISGIGVCVETGEIFPAQFTDKGPDLDIRNARTLTGGENVGLIEIYDCSREELRIGPFSYEPVRAVDFWLQQSDDFLRQALSTCPEVAPPQFVINLRAVLKRIKEDPYPSVTVFQSNCPRYYRKDEHSGRWLPSYIKEEHPQVMHHQQAPQQVLQQQQPQLTNHIPPSHHVPPTHHLASPGWVTPAPITCTDNSLTQPYY